MSTITIPKKLANEDDLVVIPRKEYTALLTFKRLREFNPTVAQKKALLSAERNFRSGKTFSYHELAAKLGFAD